MASIVFTLADGSSFSADLDCELLTVGRHEDSMVPLDSPSVSSQHATLQQRDGLWYVRDLGSRNGTRVNGAEVEEALLRDGDRVAFGDIQAIFFEGDAVIAVADPVITQPLVAIPEPVSPPPPSPVVGLPYAAPKPVNKGPRKVRREANLATGDGCVNAVIIIVLFLGAFAVGLSLRHYTETGRFFFNDIADRVFKNVSRIKIEAAPEEP